MNISKFLSVNNLFKSLEFSKFTACIKSRSKTCQFIKIDLDYNTWALNLSLTAQ